MKRYSGVLILVIIGFISGCRSSSSVIHFLNENLDTRNYLTYKLITVKTDAAEMPIEGLVLYNQIEKGILENMASKEFTISRAPDLIVRYEFVGSQRTERQAVNYYDPFINYSPTYVFKTVKEGILIIEFRDRKRKKLVWQGSLDLSFADVSPTDAAYQAVQDIMATYPYQAGANTIPEEENKKKKKDKKEESTDK